ncbi:MAG: DUF6043 family protein [Rikenellaceae bacterium]
MSKHDYDKFKAQLKRWMEENEAVYTSFEKMMSELPNEGYNAIMNRAIVLLPRFQAMVKRTMNNSTTEIELSDIVEMAQSEGLAQKLLAELNNEKSDRFVASMLAWLYLGRSWEGMIEQGEAILKRPDISWFHRIFVSLTIKMVIKASIKNGFRTKEDWDQYHKLRKVIESGEVLEWAITKDSEQTPNLSTVKPQAMIFYLSERLDEEQKDELLKRINLYLNDHPTNTSRFVATMLTALDDLRYLKSYLKGDIYKIIREEFCPNIGSDSLINHYLNPNNETKNLKNDELEEAHRIFLIN